MKNIPLILLSMCLTVNVFSQIPEKLIKNRWIKILEECINDRVILYGESVSDQYLKMVYYKKDTVTLFVNPDGGIEFGFKISDNLLTISDSIEYIISELSDTMLVLLTADLGKELQNVKRMIFMEENYLFEKILKSREIAINNDSTILSNNIIYPVFKNGTFYFFLNWYIPPYKADSENGVLSFMLTFTPDGHLIKCETINNEGLNRSFAEKVRKLVSRTDGFWELPKITAKYNFELIMCIWFPTRKESFLKLAYPNYFTINCRPVSDFQYILMKQYLDNGLQHIEKDEYEKSIADLNTCLIYSSENPEDVYYNRAYAYYKLNKMTEACSDWNFLVSRGQRYAKKLYNTYCK